MTTAREIMTAGPYTATKETPVRELAETLAEKKYSGAPVVDDNGKLIGVVTVSDLIFQHKNLHMPTVFTLFDSLIPLGGLHEVDEQMNKMLGSLVGDIMSPDPITVSEDTTLEDIATIMSEQGKHLLPVMRGDELVGVVDRTDVMKAIVKSG